MAISKLFEANAFRDGIAFAAVYFGMVFVIFSFWMALSFGWAGEAQASCGLERCPVYVDGCLLYTSDAADE